MNVDVIFASSSTLVEPARQATQTIPIVFITGQRDEALGSHLIKLGAVECLSKPFSEVDLEQAVRSDGG